MTEPYHVLRYRPAELRHFLATILSHSDIRQPSTRGSYVLLEATHIFVDALSKPNSKLEKAIEAFQQAIDLKLEQESS